MAAAQLRLLGVFALEFISDRIQELQVALMRPLLQGFDERPTQRPTRLSVLERIRSVGVSRYFFVFIHSLGNSWRRHLRCLCVLGP